MVTVTVQIAGEEYTLRAQATPEYTRQCAEYLDNVIGEIKRQAAALEMDRVAILAGLALADQLFQARTASEETRVRMADAVATLTAEIEARPGGRDLAGAS